MRLKSAFFLLSLFSLAFFSCAQSDSPVSSAFGTVIFDYKDSDSSPSLRLAVFLEINGEAQRAESFCVRNDEQKCSWNVRKPVIFASGSKNYVCSLFLSQAQNVGIIGGNYQVSYYDAAGNVSSADFFVEYDSSLLSSTAKDFRKSLPDSKEKVALYGEDKELLYMGDFKGTWKDDEAILRDYKLAQSKRICYVTPNNSVICMMPEEKLGISNE